MALGLAEDGGAILKRASTRLSQEPCLGVNIKEKRPAAGWRARLGFPGDMRGMVVEDQLDRGTGRIGGIEPLEESDELAGAVALLNRGVDLAGEQIDPGQQAERAMAFVLMIPREARMARFIPLKSRRGYERRRGTYFAA